MRRASTIAPNGRLVPLASARVLLLYGKIAYPPTSVPRANFYCSVKLVSNLWAACHTLCPQANIRSSLRSVAQPFRIKGSYLPSAANGLLQNSVNIGLAERGIRFHGPQMRYLIPLRLIERRAMASCPSGIHFTGA